MKIELIDLENELKSQLRRTIDSGRLDMAATKGWSDGFKEAVYSIAEKFEISLKCKTCGQEIYGGR